MSAKQALFDYLTDPSDLPGPAAERFMVPRVVGGHTINTRNEARRHLRSNVADKVYFERRPQDIVDHTCIVLESLTSTHETGLAGEERAAVELLQATIFARKGDAARRAANCRDYLQLAVSGWACGMWGSTYVGECVVESTRGDADPPNDASDDWTHTQTLDLAIMHDQSGSPYLPVERLSATFIYANGPGEGTSLHLAADAVVPPGRIWTTSTWTIRTGSATGPVAVTFGGQNALSTSVANTTGTNRSPSVNRAAFGLSGVFVHVTLVVADTDGNTATYAQGRNE